MAGSPADRFVGHGRVEMPAVELTFGFDWVLPKFKQGSCQHPASAPEVSNRSGRRRHIVVSGTQGVGEPVDLTACERRKCPVDQQLVAVDDSGNPK